MKALVCTTIPETPHTFENRDPSRDCLSSLEAVRKHTHTHIDTQSQRGTMQMPQWVALTTLLTLQIGRLQQERIPERGEGWDGEEGRGGKNELCCVCYAAQQEVFQKYAKFNKNRVFSFQQQQGLEFEWQILTYTFGSWLKWQILLSMRKWGDHSYSFKSLGLNYRFSTFLTLKCFRYKSYSERVTWTCHKK